MWYNVCGDFMIYLDYSATTKTSEEVLDTFVKCSKEFIGNPNSLHGLGVKSKNMIDKANFQISQLLGVKEDEIIYTSGASESNNLAIKGICYKVGAAYTCIDKTTYGDYFKITSSDAVKVFKASN